MNFYQELQLNQAGSKSYIASFKNPKDKWSLNTEPCKWQ